MLATLEKCSLHSAYLIILVGAGPPFGSFLAVGIQQIVEICGIHGKFNLNLLLCKVGGFVEPDFRVFEVTC